METKIAAFKGRKIRRILQGSEWWFVIEDVVLTLIDSNDPKQYIQRMKQRDPELSKGWVQIVRTLAVATSGGQQNMICANTEGIFRIIQSIPSPKAEPFKRWLAKVGYERVQEIENPELGIQRTKALYEKKGYPKDWIEKRLRGIAVRQKLTDEWDVRGAEVDQDYAVLTNEILQGAFEMKAEDYKKHKGLSRQNLRDHMNDLELIIAMLGEAATTRITQDRDSQGMPKLQKDAQDGGAVAGRTRKDIEQQTGTKVVSKENYLPGKSRKRLE
jgi:prophage antirepressor-like protein